MTTLASNLSIALRKVLVQHWQKLAIVILVLHGGFMQFKVHNLEKEVGNTITATQLHYDNLSMELNAVNQQLTSQLYQEVGQTVADNLQKAGQLVQDSEKQKQALTALPSDQLWQQFSQEFSIEVTNTSL